MKLCLQLLALCVCILVCSCTSNASNSGSGDAPAAQGNLKPDVLKVGLLPDEDPASVIADNKPFAEYLEKALGCKVELIVPHDYSVLIESMRAGRLHLAYFGPASYITCKDKGCNISPFAAKLKNGQTTYHSLIVGNPDLVKELKDIKGKKMGYGDPGSTSSHLIPKGELLSVDLQPRRDYEESFLGSHDAVALNVQSASIAAGGMSASIYEKLVKQGTIDKSKVVVLHKSPAFPQYPWAWRDDLDPALKKSIQDAFINLKDETILKHLHAGGFAAIDDKAYDVVRTLEEKVAEYR